MMKAQNSKSNNQILSPLLRFAISCLVLAVSACGYTLHNRASLPFQEIAVGLIENRTPEPKLQDKLYQSLNEEFLKQGIPVRHDALYKLSGTIDQFDLRVLSERSDVATEYEVIIKGNFKLVDPEGNIKEFKNIGSPFIIAFSGSGQLNELLAFKEVASQRALRDMAEEIVSVLMYK
jgi:outer membrane lipopolysaccharide assembly protein LptE/RlpB